MMRRVADVQERNSWEALVVPDAKVSVEISEKIEDRDWDAFLESTPLGQFQQSSMWAKAKAQQGWHVARFIVCNNCGEYEGGLQLLWRKKHLLRIGYISKGPVFQKDSGQLVGSSSHLVAMAANKYGIHALIVQAPDFAPQVASFFSERPFEENRFSSVISANLMIDLTQGIAGIRKGMSRTVRQMSRQARERGVTILEGSESDLGVFFQLLLATCCRQGEKNPNPETLDQLQHIWGAFHGKGHIRLTLAVCDGVIVAGLVSITFGSRITLWKKAWNGQFSERHPNQLLISECIEWAVHRGCECCDFLSLDRSLAETLVHGRALNDDQKKRRDFYKLHFGGKPVLLPESRAYVRNPLLAALYRGVVRCRRAQRRFQPCPR